MNTIEIDQCIVSHEVDADDARRLRREDPVRHFMRTATQDVEIRGRKIAAGDRRLLPYPSENFDEEASASRIGSRSGLRAFFAALLPRIEHIALDGDPSFIQTTVVGGLKTLPLRYAPTRCAA